MLSLNFLPECLFICIFKVEEWNVFALFSRKCRTDKYCSWQKLPNICKITDKWSSYFIDLFIFCVDCVFYSRFQINPFCSVLSNNYTQTDLKLSSRQFRLIWFRLISCKDCFRDLPWKERASGFSQQWSVMWTKKLGNQINFKKNCV